MSDDLSIAVDAVIEIKRLRAEIERLRQAHQAACEGGDLLRAEIERLYNEDTKTRHALKGWAFVCPDGGDEPTHERVAAVVAEIERLRSELALMKSGFEIAYRAMGDKP